MPEGSTLADALKETTSKSAGYRTLEKTSAQLGAFIEGKEPMKPSVMRDLCTGLRADEAQTSFMMGLTGASGSKATETGTDAIYARLRAARTAAVPTAPNVVSDVEVLPSVVSPPGEYVAADPTRAEPVNIRPDRRTTRKVVCCAWLHSTVSRRFRKLDGPTKFMAILLAVLLVLALFEWAQTTFSHTTVSVPDSGRYDPGLGNVALVALPRETDVEAKAPLLLGDVDQAVIADNDVEAPVFRLDVDSYAVLTVEEHEFGTIVPPVDMDITIPIRVIFHAPPASATSVEESSGQPPIELSATLEGSQRRPGDPPQTYYALGAVTHEDRIWDLPTRTGWWSTPKLANSEGLELSKFGATVRVGWTHGDSVAEAGMDLGLRRSALQCGLNELHIEATIHMRNAAVIDSAIRRINFSVDKKCST